MRVRRGVVSPKATCVAMEYCGRFFGGISCLECVLSISLLSFWKHVHVVSEKHETADCNHQKIDRESDPGHYTCERLDNGQRGARVNQKSQTEGGRGDTWDLLGREWGALGVVRCCRGAWSGALDVATLASSAAAGPATYKHPAGNGLRRVVPERCANLA